MLSKMVDDIYLITLHLSKMPTLVTTAHLQTKSKDARDKVPVTRYLYQELKLANSRSSFQSSRRSPSFP
jgi:hypothetical protein